MWKEAGFFYSSCYILLIYTKQYTTVRSKDEQINVDINTILAGTAVHLRAWKELCRNKHMETFLNPATITHIGGLNRWQYFLKLYCGYFAEIPWSITQEGYSWLQYHINSVLHSWKM